MREKESFMVRHPDVKVKADYNKEQFAKAVSDWSKDQRAKRIQLEGIKKEVSGLASDKGKKEVLLKHNYLRVGQDIEELLTESSIKMAQMGQFLEEVVYKEVPDPLRAGKTMTIFTPEAAALLLKSVGVFK